MVNGFVKNEGDVQIKLESPYQISYKSIIPKENECVNIIVPVCLSSSHIAYGSIRMEPVFMILGESTGIIASLALDKNESLYNLSYKDIKSKLYLKMVRLWI